MAGRPFRFPVQLAVRPQTAAGPGFAEYRGYAGQVASGAVQVGDEVIVLPSVSRTIVGGIDTFHVALTRASAPQPVPLGPPAADSWT